LDTLILGGTLITMDDEKGVIKEGSVLIRDSRIEFVGSRSEGESFSADRVIDAKGKYILPGFINMHCHMFQVLLRTVGADMVLLDWLKRVIWPIVPKMSYEDVYSGAMLAIAENIKSGVTTITEMHYGNPHFEAVLKAFEDTKVRGFLSRGFYEIEAYEPLREKSDDVLDDLRRLMEKYDNVMPGPMHPCFVSNDLLVAAKELADRFGRNYYTHLAESEPDVQLLVKREGKRDAELLYDLGILDERFIGIHACKLNDKEISYLGETRSNTVHCPTSNMYIADGISPVIELAKKGVNVCLATDGPASTGRQDLFSEMKTAALLHKVYHENPAIITARDVLEMATVNGARALGIKAGVIKEGYLADLIILDMWKVNTVHSFDPIGAVVYSATPENVDTVIVDGRILMEGRRLSFLDEDEILKRAHETAEKLVSGR